MQKFTIIDFNGCLSDDREKISTCLKFPLCFQQEYLRLPKNLMLTLHDLTKKWPKMTSNDLKSKNYRTKTPTKI